MRKLTPEEEAQVNRLTYRASKFIRLNLKSVLPADRYLAVLERLRARIEGGLELDAEDSTTIGDKYTRCTWGLCSDELETWPDVEDHKWPDSFFLHDRVAPLRQAKGCVCPMDGRPNELEVDPTGCFHRCLVFQGIKGGGSVWKLDEEKRVAWALVAFDVAIERAKEALRQLELNVMEAEEFASDVRMSMQRNEHRW